ncbi:MAG: sugar transferase [Azoarcus sp.]|jgi:lipopolysaccharide/colanic/teichoic acid biosynthesis glycosyltransferase|nr:sugar transferase [Azoarcus sp.]
MLKRTFDLFCSLVGLVFLSPFFLVVALLIKRDSPGPVFFRQERVGRGGKHFRIHKFRTMRVNAEDEGLRITTGKDSRITSIGAFLRKYKIDELPQLLDVVAGNMSLVGPRPEVPEYVAYYPPGVRVKVLSIRPGITDPASIAFRDENEILDRTNNPQKVYIEEILPVKLKYYIDYVDNASFLFDLKIIFKTLRAIIA